jgi:hypothetical protein
MWGEPRGGLGVTGEGDFNLFLAVVFLVGVSLLGWDRLAGARKPKH